ncbi:MAG: nucleotidyl transferase AbiEii/AbiGii toxin family protein, partial [Planctomycetes bacterium]|nr:nucleotidyl transferase AbiEii/AbiGii toxin family protein [Planctomycetota bacterium]
MNHAIRAHELLRTLASIGVESALVGGLAVSLRSRERFTRDIDFAIAVDSDEHSELVGRAMQRAGYELQMVIEQEAQGIIATLRFRHPREGSAHPSVDLLCGSTGIEREIVESATMENLSADHAVPVATRAHLIAMKVLSENDNRPNDGADLMALLAVATADELQAVLRSLELIQDRGFDRG